MLDAHFSQFDIISFRNLSSCDQSIHHSGDELFGYTKGDDETISVDLSMVDQAVKYIVLLINSFSGQHLGNVDRAKCHLYDRRTERDIASYVMSNAEELDQKTALVMCCLYQDDGVWFLNVIAKPDRGRMASSCLKSIKSQVQTIQTATSPSAAQQILQNVSTAMPATR